MHSRSIKNYDKGMSMVIVKFTSTKILCIDNNKFVQWEVFHTTEAAGKYIEEEVDKIEASNNRCDSIVQHHRGASQLYTLEQFDKLSLHEIENMEVGMLFRIKMICKG